MKQYMILLISMLFLLETIYFNILFDYMLVIVLIVLALALGSYMPLRIKGIDAILVKIALGLGGLSFFIWLSTFYNLHHKSFFILCAICLILIRSKALSIDIKYIYKYMRELIQTHTLLLLLLISGLIFYTIPASYPIAQWDSLAKHIVIPFLISVHGYYDYNVVESIIFGDYALLAHMLYFFLMVLGGTKALVLLNVIISLLTLLTILRFSYFLIRDKLPLYLITLLYFTTPLIYTYSTILNVDIYPVFFISIVLLLLYYDSLPFLSKNLPSIALLCGFSFFAKQVAFYMIIPICLYISVILIKKYKYITLSIMWRIFISLGLFFAPFVPIIVVIWYKTGNPLFPFLNKLFQSSYFALVNFQDPYAVWKRFLHFDLSSLWSIVANTSRNTEYVNGGTGFHLLLLPLVLLIWLMIWRNRYIFVLIFVTFGSYWISITFFNPNIRYFFGAIVIAIPLTILAYYKLILKLKFTKVFISLLIVAICGLCGMNVYVLTKPNNSWGFKTLMLTPNDKLTLSPAEDILSTINHKDIYLLTNNENLRGTYKGHFYTLTWYNTFFISKLTSGEISPVNFLMNFDYYLINKMIPLKQENHFSLDNSEINNTLELVSETNTHKLFKVKKTYEVWSEEKFSEPIIANVSNPKVIHFVHKDTKAYKISLDVMPTTSKLTMGRFQINWVDEKGKFVGTSLSVFELKDQQKSLYTSNIIVDIPEKAAAGHLYLTGHTEEQIKFFGYKLERQSDNHLIKNELKKYGQKLMPTY